MKSHYLLFSFCFVFLIKVGQINAQQPGFLLLKDGRTLKGKVVQRDGSHVQLNTSIKTEVIHGSQINVWGLDNGKRFHYIAGAPGDTAKTFKRLLVQGYLNLYQNGNSFLVARSGTDTLYSLEEEKSVAGTVQKLKKRYVGALTYILRDCPRMIPEIQRVKFELKALSDFIYAYNACVAPEVSNTKHLGYEQVHYEWGLHAGTTGNSVQLLTDDHLMAVKSLKFDSQWSYFIGVHFQANFKSGLAARIGLNYSPKPTRGNGSTPYESFSATLDNTWLEIPVSALYYLRRDKRLNPYLLGGGIANFSKLGENYRVVTQQNGNARITPLLLSNYGVGFTVGAGMRWNLAARTILDLEYYYQRTSVTFVYSVNFIAHHIHLRLGRAISSSKSKHKK